MMEKEYSITWDPPDQADLELLIGDFYVEDSEGRYGSPGFSIRRKQINHTIGWWYVLIIYNAGWRPENEEEFQQAWLDIVRIRYGKLQ